MHKNGTAKAGMRRNPRDPHDDPPRFRDRPRAPAGPVPTIGQLLRQRMGNWVWVSCHNPDCRHCRAMALAPFAIRWGMGASSDTIRERLRCSACGTKGVTITAPSWADSTTGWQPFPEAREL